MKHNPPRTAPPPPQAPGAVDRQLRRCGAGKEVRRGDGVFELLRLDPPSVLDAQATEQADVGRWTPNPMHPRRSHSFPIVLSDTCGERSVLDPDLLLPVMGSHRRALRWPTPEAGAWWTPGSSTFGRRQIGAAVLPSMTCRGRSEEPFGLHLVQRGVETPWTDSVAVMGQLLRHPGAGTSPFPRDGMCSRTAPRRNSRIAAPKLISISDICVRYLGRGDAALRSGSGSEISDKSAEICDGRIEAG